LKILVLESLDWCTILCSVNFRPKRFTAQVQAGLVGVDPLSAILLFMTLFPLEDASHFVPVGVVARIRPPLLLVIVSIVVLRVVILTILLASILLV